MRQGPDNLSFIIQEIAAKGRNLVKETMEGVAG
jgi:hypothetical protein